ncbi:MAG: trypsin-like serine protease [Myxococcota bacterium]
MGRVEGSGGARWWLGVAALCGVATLGCDPDGGPRPLGVRGDATGGLLATHSPIYDVVFSLARPDPVAFALPVCSATLIAPTVLLTAAHCVTAEPGDGSYRVQDPDAFFVSAGADVEVLREDLQVVEIAVHPDYIAGSAYRDLAVVVVDDDATAFTNGLVMPVARGLGKGYIGLPRGIDLVGHGGTEYPEPFERNEDRGPGTRLHVPHELASFGCAAEDPACDDAAVSLSFDNSPQAGFCGADLGGPVLLFRDGGGEPTPVPWQYLQTDSPIPPGGTAEVAGVVSRIVPRDGCRGEGLVARVDTAGAFLSPYLR